MRGFRRRLRSKNWEPEPAGVAARIQDRGVLSEQPVSGNQILSTGCKDLKILFKGDFPVTAEKIRLFSATSSL